MNARTLRAAQAYHRVALQTAPTLNAIVMLYDGVLRNVREAAEAAVDGRIEDRCRCIDRAVAILDGLNAALDFKRAERLASILRSFYTSMIFQLLRAGQKPDAHARLARIADQVRRVRNAWATIADGPPEVSCNGAPGVEASV